MKCTYHLAPPHKLLPYPCPICGGKFGTAQIVVLNGVLRHSVKHPYFRSELEDYAFRRKYFLKSLKWGNDQLYTCCENNLLFRIHHYSPEKYGNIKKQLKFARWKKEPRKIKKAYGREIHSFKTRYKSETKTYRSPLQDIFLAPSYFNLKRNQRSKSWPLSEKSVSEKNDWLNKAYEMIKEHGWYYREPRSRRII